MEDLPTSPEYAGWCEVHRILTELGVIDDQLADEYDSDSIEEGLYQATVAGGELAHALNKVGPFLVADVETMRGLDTDRKILMLDQPNLIRIQRRQDGSRRLSLLFAFTDPASAPSSSSRTTTQTARLKVEGLTLQPVFELDEDIKDDIASDYVKTVFEFAKKNGRVDLVELNEMVAQLSGVKLEYLVRGLASEKPTGHIRAMFARYTSYEHGAVTSRHDYGDSEVVIDTSLDEYDFHGLEIEANESRLPYLCVVLRVSKQPSQLIKITVSDISLHCLYDA